MDDNTNENPQDNVTDDGGLMVLVTDSFGETGGKDEDGSGNENDNG